MANTYTIPKARQRWIDPTNQDFTLKALMFTQQKYDANRAKVDSIVEQYQSLQLARDVDKDYLNERLTNLVNTVNASQDGNFSSNATTAAAINHIGLALDANVTTAMQQTAKIKNYYAEVANIKEKTPDKYNETNEAYGLRAAQEYLNNSELGAKIQGQLSYTNYTDVHGEMNKHLLEIQKSAKNGKVQIPVMKDVLDSAGNPTGEKVRTGEVQEVTVNGLSSQELRDVAINFMGNRFDNQIKINSWGSTGGFQNMDAVVQGATQQYDVLISKRTAEQAELESQLTGKISDEDREKTLTKIQSLKNEIISAREMQQGMLANPEGALMFIEKNKMANSAAGALGLLRTESVEYKKDDYYFASLDTALNQEKFAFEKEQKAFENELAVKKLELAERELAVKADGESSQSTDTNGNVIAGGNGIIMSTEGLPADAANQESPHNAWKNTIGQQYKEMDQFGNSVMNKVISIANGTDPNSDKEKVAAAKALISKMKASGVNVNTRNGKIIQTFMQELSRADAYESLQFLPIEGNTNINVKNTYGTMLRDWSKNSNTYKQAREAAIKAERSKGSGKHFQDNFEFNKIAEKYGNEARFQNIASAVVTTKNKGNMTRLLSLSEEARTLGVTAALEENSGITIKDLKNGKVQVTYQTKVKDKETGVDQMVNQIATINKKDAESVIPELKAISGVKSRYTIDSMGTKELYSPKIGFIRKGSPNFDDYTESLSLYSKNPGQDANLLDVEDAKRTAKNAILGPGIKKNSELAAQLSQVVDAVFSDKVYNNISTSVFYRNSANSPNGRGYVGVNSKKSGNLFSISLLGKESLDEEVGLNEYLPQVIYSRAMIQKLTEMASESQQAGKLVITPEIQKLLNLNG